LRRCCGPQHNQTLAVDVWSADLFGAPDPRALEQLLDERERASLQRCRPEIDARRVGTRATVRRVLARYAGQAPHTLEFDTDPYGKPRLRQRRARRSLRFSVSRSNERCFVAVTRGADVGVDVETRAAPLAERDGIISRLAPEETMALRALADDDRIAALLRCWTRKEAYLKAAGAPLALGLDQCAVSIGGDARVARALGGDAHAWVLRDLALDREHVGAVAVRSGGRPVATRNLELDW
jgi:4'-phosphopantetheinyl transferase